MTGKKKKSILCVDDEQDILEILVYNLEKEGYKVHTADDGEKALALAEKVRPDLVLLDIMMPEMDGIEVCKALRANDKLKNVVIVFLTAKSDEIDEILGLEVGGDDYVTKPFSPRKIVAKIRALFRRIDVDRENGKKEIIKINGIEINRISYTVTVGDKPVKFLHKEFELLYFLMKRPEVVFSRSNLLYHVWGEDAYYVDRTVDVHITKIRKKLGEFSRCIQTVQGVGYKFSVKTD